MAERYDWIAIGPYGVYALMDAQLATKREIASFKAKATRLGHRTELVTVAEACARHREYIDLCDRVRSAATAVLASAIPTQSPTDPASPLSRGEGAS